ncbi:hypothetical protein PUR58_00305, partial [Streptomyces sp. JV186]|nr:hypothetical protein [Streptomyces sp. JV186]
FDLGGDTNHSTQQYAKPLRAAHDHSSRDLFARQTLAPLADDHLRDPAGRQDPAAGPLPALPPEAPPLHAQAAGRLGLVGEGDAPAPGGPHHHPAAPLQAVG